MKIISEKVCQMNTFDIFKFAVRLAMGILWAFAAQAQLPTGCSSADATRAANYTERAVHAAENGEQPTRTRCSADERVALMEHYQALITASNRGNVGRVIGLFDSMENAVSERCWLAANEPDAPVVRRACTPTELNVMAQYAGPVVRATSRFLITFDPTEILQLAAGQNARLSPECQTAVARTQQEAQQKSERLPPGRSLQVPMPHINDHGGGLISGPGVACGHNGCMLF
jgi:hypothetical protein